MTTDRTCSECDWLEGFTGDMGGRVWLCCAGRVPCRLTHPDCPACEIFSDGGRYEANGWEESDDRDR